MIKQFKTATCIELFTLLLFSDSSWNFLLGPMGHAILGVSGLNFFLYF